MLKSRLLAIILLIRLFAPAHELLITVLLTVDKNKPDL